ncbi:MAG TPA: glycosyl hydrolase [Ferruginibacter sp.]|jgi:mannan endo-1,4-beta-mannosidase|nr:glycosyl hydrolase [Ferruginibacter sp.]
MINTERGRKFEWLYGKETGLLFLLLAGICFLNTLYAQHCSDKQATPATKALYKNLYALKSEYTLFGQQDALAYGVGWKGISGQSDIRLLVNDQPGVYGWDIAHIELDSSRNIDGVPFKKMLQYIREGFERGAVITVSWHARNPLSGGSAWDTTAGTVASILPGGNKHVVFKKWLDKVASFFLQCRDKKGNAIPVLFRPFHEMTGNWFWWCKNVCTPGEYKQLWNFTRNYLQQEKKLHNLVYVYNSAGFASPEEYLERYPGDDKVDVLSMDAYQYQQGKEQRESFINTTRRQLTYIAAIAKEKKKIAALAETGFEAVPDPQWWTGTLWPATKDIGISYVLVWRNHGYMAKEKKMHYYAPYPGQVSAADFKLFYSNRFLLFEKSLSKKNIYK